MKIKTLILLALLTVPTVLSAQNTLSYFLPSTHLSVEVETVQESFFAGPYAAFAKKMLGLDVRQENEVKTYITSLTLEPTVEADPAAHYAATASSAVSQALILSSQGLVSFGASGSADALKWTFPVRPDGDFSRMGVTSPYRTEKKVTYKTVQTDSSVNKVAVTQDVVVAKTLEQRAREAADMVLKARQERFNITIGNTDATYSGEALGSAIAELARMEEEYLTLFVGYSVRKPQTASFDIHPVAGKTEQTYPVFRLSPEEGLSPAEGGEGTLYFLTLKPSAVSAPVQEGEAGKAGKVVETLRYRIPAVCETVLSNGREVLLRTRIPVYQLGTESTYPIFK